MRKVKYYVATTLDGFIAREDGSWDFFVSEGEHIADYLDSLKSFDAVLMGRKTYEVGLKMGVTDPYPDLKSYVITQTMTESPHEKVKLVSGEIGDFVRELKNEVGQNIYFCGGAELAAQLFAEDLIDEVILKVHPVFIGSGIPLIAGVVKETQMNLISCKSFRTGVVILQYEVKK